MPFYSQSLAKRLTFQTLHGDERLALVFLNCVNGADFGMVERRRSPRLAAERSLELAVLGQFFGQELERHAAAELGVLGLVHHALPPPPNFSRMR